MLQQPNLSVMISLIKLNKRRTAHERTAKVKKGHVPFIHIFSE